MFYANTNYRLPIYYKGLNILVGMFVLYGIFMIILEGSLIYSPSGQSIPTKNYLQTILSSLLSLYPFFVFAKKRLLTINKLRMWTIVFFLVATASFYREEQERLNRLLLEGIYAEEVTNNSGYIMLSLLPLLILFKNKPIIQYLGLSYILYFVIISMKRGAILVGLICLVYFLYRSLRNNTGNKRLLIVILILSLFYIGVNFVKKYSDQSSYMQSRIEQTQAGSSSGRDIYYAALWDHFANESNIITMLIGNGAEGAFHAGGYVAHNDWLELLLGQGIIGIIIYIYYWKCFYCSWRCEMNPDAKSIIGLIFLIFFIKTFFSMSYQSMIIYSNSILALCLSERFVEE